MITSILDNDLYKFTMQWAVHKCFPGIKVKYRFTNRDPSMRWSKEGFKELEKRINALRDLKLQADEEDFLREKAPFFPDVYIGYLKQFRHHPEMIDLNLDSQGNLSFDIDGDWDHGILFEVVLMAIISQTYFEYEDKDWKWDWDVYQKNAIMKGVTLTDAGCVWADFGTRRRRSYRAQDCAVSAMQGFKNFVGTSNVHFAHKYNLKPIGTMAHEWIMGNSALCGLRHANRYALRNWAEVYGADLGIALTDTYGTKAFFEDFDMSLAKLFDGPRHDSASPYDFADNVIADYEKKRIDPTAKTIVFSDSLNVPSERNGFEVPPNKNPCQINQYCKGKIRCSFGIGTDITNDFMKVSDPSVRSKAMNMVIKLRKCDGTNVVKISDEPGKMTGDKDAQRVAAWTFFNEPLDKVR